MVPGTSWSRSIILPGMGDSTPGLAGLHPRCLEGSRRPLPAQQPLGRACCRSVQGCSLSADGNALLRHGRAAWWHFGDIRDCWEPPSPGSTALPAAAERSHRERQAQHGELSSGSSFPGLCGSCCSSSWGWDCSSRSFQSIRGAPSQRGSQNCNIVWVGRDL